MTLWPRPSTIPAIDPISGKPTAPLHPNLRYLGRFLDSQSEREWQDPIRTLRARKFSYNQATQRLYEIQGSTLVGYNFQRMQERMTAQEPLRAVGRAGSVLSWDMSFNVLTSSWKLDNTDGQDRLFGIDSDDRGYVYVATDPFGWGIIDAITGQSVYQNYPPDTASFQMISFRVGAKYYVVVSPQIGPSLIYDVTNVTAPIHTGGLSRPVTTWARLNNGTVGIIDGFALQIYTPDRLVIGRPLTFVPGSWIDVASDGEKFYIIDRDKNIRSVTGGGTATVVNLPLPSYVNRIGIRAGAGVIAVFGQESGGTNLRLFANGEQLDFGTFFGNYYSAIRARAKGYAAPLATGIDPASGGDVLLFPRGAGRVGILIGAGGLGDGYEFSVDGAPAATPTPPTASPASPPAPVQPPPAPVVPPTSPASPAGSPFVSAVGGPKDIWGVPMADVSEAADRERWRKRMTDRKLPFMESEFMAWRKAYRGL